MQRAWTTAGAGSSGWVTIRVRKSGSMRLLRSARDGQNDKERSRKVERTARSAGERCRPHRTPTIRWAGQPCLLSPEHGLKRSTDTVTSTAPLRTCARVCIDWRVVSNGAAPVSPRSHGAEGWPRITFGPCLFAPAASRRLGTAGDHCHQFFRLAGLRKHIESLQLNRVHAFCIARHQHHL